MTRRHCPARRLEYIQKSPVSLLSTAIIQLIVIIMDVLSEDKCSCQQCMDEQAEMCMANHCECCKH